MVFLRVAVLHRFYCIILQGLQKVAAVSLQIGYRNQATDAIIAGLKKKKSQESVVSEAKNVK